ncbi:MAG: multidrug efflux RND transporter permease subunit [Victivallales bacterium]|nr:multidrug efflux RND transporter permease subunit [Victivallales bacterium]MCF7889217.1 multidrug efflux RND transporter permease subunit [Victivallales bacterium]
MLSNFFIKRPKFAIVTAIVTILIGVIAALSLPVQKFPNITPPQVSVSAKYPGADSEAIMETVIEPLEARINGVKDMIYMSSKASNTGAADIKITFKIGTDPNINAINVQNRVQQAMPIMPQVVKREGVTVKQVSGECLLFVSVFSPHKTYDSLYLSNYTDLNIKNELLLIDGVGKARIFGEHTYAMRIWLNPKKITVLNLTMEEVISAIKNQNVQVATGQLGSPPIDKDQIIEYIVQTQGRLSSVKEFKNIIIRELEDGSYIRLKDIAKVELGSRNYNSYGKVGKQASANLAIYRQPGANSLRVAGAVKKKLKKLSKKFPKDLKAEVLYDTTKFVSASIRQVISTLVIAFILVVIVVTLFLQNFRSVMIPTLAIPVSIIGTFIILAAAGFSVNIITMLAMVLAIGLVVDDAIVVIENVNRIMGEKGLKPVEATRESMDQVTGPIVATTLVLMAVFVPVAFIPGLTGQLYRQFAVTIIIAIVFSAFNALTLTPALCSIILKPPEAGKKRKFILFRLFDRGYEFIADKYNRLVALMLKKLSIAAIFFVLLLCAVYMLYNKIPAGFMPREDQGAFMVDIQLPNGAALPRTGRITKRASELISNIEGVDWVLSMTGYSVLKEATQSNSAYLVACLAPWSKRQSPGLSQRAIIWKAKKKLSNIKGAKIMPFAPPPIPGLGVSAGLQYELMGGAGVSAKKLNIYTQYLLQKANELPELSYAYTSHQKGSPELFVDIDRMKARRLNIPLKRIYNILHANLGSFYINNFNKFGKVYQVIVQADKKYRRSVRNIRQLHVQNKKGKMVPLATLVNIRPKISPEINHYNTHPSISVNGASAPGYSFGQAMSAMEKLSDQILPKDMTYSWTGTAYQQKLAGNKIIIIFILAVVFLYLFLVAQYESWLLAFCVILSIPFAFLGSLAAIWCFGLQNNIFTQIGFVLMFGLASKTAILIVEFAKKQRESGKSIRDSAAYAAKIRYRPILMTSFAFLFGVMPLVIATGAGAGNCRAIGTSVFGGMIFVAVIGIIFVPAFYMILQKIAERKK